METITDEIANFLKHERLGFVATVSPDGKPNVSPKGSIMALSDHQLAFADIRSPDTVSNIEINPDVEISIISPIARRGYLFVGRGRVVSRGAELAEMQRRFKDMGIKNTVGAAVIIDVSRVEETKSPLYDLGYTEEQIKADWTRRYFPS